MRCVPANLAKLIWAAFLFGSFTTAVTAGAKGVPLISGRSLSGETFDLSAERGKVVVINFWATWCLPCRAEMPSMESYYQGHHAQGLEMIAISMDDPSKVAAVRSVAADYHFAVAIARDARIPGAYRPSQLPVTLVFGRDGRLRFDSRRSPGLMTQAQLDRVVGPLLAEAGR